MDTSKTAGKGAVPILLTDVTQRCISILKDIPSYRQEERFSLDTPIIALAGEDQIDTKNNNRALKDELFSDKIIPQEQSNESVIDKINEANDRIKTQIVTLFPNYACTILEISNPENLVLVCISNELEINPGNTYPESLPFLFHIHPSPQDTLKDHKVFLSKIKLVKNDKDIVLNFHNEKEFPYEWDWLFFQFYLNIRKFTYQIKKSGKPYVLVIPLVKNYSVGIGKLNDASYMEKCLVGIQKYLFDKKIGKNKYALPDLEWVSVSCFSIGCDFLNKFIVSNRENNFFRDVIKEFIVFDPPPHNPNNRSQVVHSVISVLRTNPKQILQLYAQDSYYINIVLNFLLQKGIKVDFNKNYFFNDASYSQIIVANLSAKKWDKLGIAGANVIHSQIPLFFMKVALQENLLKLRRHSAYITSGNLKKRQ